MTHERWVDIHLVDMPVAFGHWNYGARITPNYNYGDSALNCGPSFTSACVGGFDLRTHGSMRQSLTGGDEIVQNRRVARPKKFELLTPR
jgi:hypothetical protein